MLIKKTSRSIDLQCKLMDTKVTLSFNAGSCRESENMLKKRESA